MRPEAEASGYLEANANANAKATANANANANAEILHCVQNDGVRGGDRCGVGRLAAVVGGDGAATD
jgi:hypothetical protein